MRKRRFRRLLCPTPPFVLELQTGHLQLRKFPDLHIDVSFSKPPQSSLEELPIPTARKRDRRLNDELEADSSIFVVRQGEEALLGIDRPLGCSLEGDEGDERRGAGEAQFCGTVDRRLRDETVARSVPELGEAGSQEKLALRVFRAFQVRD